MPIPAITAFNGSQIDGSVFTAITNFARATPWLNTPLAMWTDAGLCVFAILMLAGFLRARRRSDLAMAWALMAPVSVAVAFVIAELIKKVVAEPRPCRALPHDFYVTACGAPNDYALPSGHATVAVATVGALVLLDRGLAAIATLFAVLEGFTRVYVGAHYPHDVLVSAALALPIAYLSSVLFGRVAAPLIARLRTGTLRAVLTADARPAPTE
jgi:membrane-associated phospholipid phosphatase